MINLNQKAIDLRDFKFDALLANQQGNILKSHGRDFSTNIFVRFDTGKLTEVKAWLKNFAETTVTSCKKQLREIERFKRHHISGDLFGAIYLSAKGYEYLEPGLDPLSKFLDQSFVHGMKLATLEDPAVSEWENGFREDIHAMILLADDEQDAVGRKSKEILGQLENIASILTIEYGSAIRNANGDGLEHNGYVDGVSQPLFFKDEVDGYSVANLHPLQFDPSAKLDLVLVKDPFTSEEDSFGSYFVFRKLEQNVQGFNEAEEKLADALELKGEDRERAGAMIVGRFEDGTPVTLSDENNMISSGIINNFNYNNDSHGAKCPFHGHIRKSNPRRSPQDKERIMARRGIAYGTRSVNPAIEPSLLQMPTGGVGLLFMSFQKSITNQFEFIQKSWVNDPNFPSHDAGIDPIIGQGQPESTGAFATTYGDESSLKKVSFEKFIHFKGGEYFFAPSIPYLLKNN